MTSDARRLLVFAASYLFIAVPEIGARIGLRLTRPVAALAGAVLMVVVGGLPLAQAYAAIDLDVLAFLLGVLVLVAYLERAGAFDRAAVAAVARARSPRTLLAAVVAVSGVASAFVMNDTVCVVLTPLVLGALDRLAARGRRLRALPFLLAVALAANVGSAMAITGNPQNMIVGLASGIGFGAFLAALAPAALGGLAIVYGVLVLAFRRDLAAAPVTTSRATLPEPSTARPFDRPLARLATAVFGLCVAGWLAGLSLPLVALGGAATLLVLARRDPTPVLAEGVDWPLLLFFAALFVVTRGVRDTALVTAGTRLALGGLRGADAVGPRLADAAAVGAAMIGLSNVVSNVPAVLLWRPAVAALPHARFVWLAVAMSSTFAGNLTLVGSMANLIVAERAGARGERLGFWDYLKVGAPVTLLTTAWGVVALALWSG